MTAPEDDRREHILACAARLFDHYSASKTTIADIAREAGIGVGTVYLEFSSKDAIVEVLSSHRHHAVLSAMRVAARPPWASHETRIARVLIARTTAFLKLAKVGTHACEMVHCRSAAVKTTHEKFIEDERAFLAELLVEGSVEEQFTAGEPLLIARGIQLAHTSLSPPWLFEMDPREAHEAAQALAALVLRGLLVR